MDIKQLRYFLAIAHEGSFSRAAAALHMTQPPLSLAISHLEKELDIKLFHRHPHGISTTQAGDFLMLQGAPILLRLGQIEEHLKNMGQGLAGRLQIAAVPSFSWSYLTPLLKSFANLAPGVVIELADPTPRDTLDQVNAGTADVGIVATGNPRALAAEYAGELHVRKLLAMPTVAVLPLRFSESPDPLDIRSLISETWLIPQGFERFPGMEKIIEDAWLQAGTQPTTVRTVGTLQTALPLIAADMGIAFMPESIAEACGSNIVIRHFSEPIDSLQACLVWSQKLAPTPAASLFIDMALANAAETDAGG